MRLEDGLCNWRERRSQEADGGVGTLITSSHTPVWWEVTARCLRCNIGEAGRGVEGKGGRTRDCTVRKKGGHYRSSQGGGQRGGMSAARDLLKSANGSCRRSRGSRSCSPKEWAAGQRPQESSPEPFSQFSRIQCRRSRTAVPPGSEQESHWSITRIINVVYRLQWQLRAKVIMVHIGRLAPCLEATWDEQT
jgi:hypothetical protein